MAPKKRGAESDSVTVEQGKRYKSAIDDVASEFVCPISQELPLDLRVFEDPRVRATHLTLRRRRLPQERRPLDDGEEDDDVASDVGTT